MRRVLAVVFVVAVTALIGTACGRPTSPASRSAPPKSETPDIPIATGFGTVPAVHFAGRVSAGDLTAAVAVVGTTVVGYICDCRSADAWLTGEAVQDGRSELKPADPAASTGISVVIDDHQAIGTLTWRGRTFEISFPAVDSGFGLYRAKQGALSGGWIRLPGATGGTGTVATSCGIVTANGRPTASSPFTGTGPVEVPNHGTLTPKRIGSA